jgi:hypothetical protein
MLHFEINFIHWLVIAFVNFFLSWLWYSPVLFAKPWAAALGLKMDGQMTDAQKKEMPFLFLSAIVSSLLFTYLLYVFILTLGATTALQGATIGAFLYLGFSLTGSLNTVWEGRKMIVLLINNGLFLLTFAGFGAIFALWK